MGVTVGRRVPDPFRHLRAHMIDGVLHTNQVDQQIRDLYFHFCSEPCLLIRTVSGGISKRTNNKVYFIEDFYSAFTLLHSGLQQAQVMQCSEKLC